MRSGSARIVTPYVLVSLALLAPEARAYLDPSTGSMILSAIVGMFATAALALKTYWYKLKGLFRGQSGPPSAPPAQKPGQASGQNSEQQSAHKPAQDAKPAAD